MSRNSIQKPRTNLQYIHIPTNWLFSSALKTSNENNDSKTNTNHKITTNYRPISLLSWIGNYWKKIVANKIRGQLKKRKLFNQWQLGYRNKRCAMEHILRLTDDALTGLQANRLGIAVFIDVEKNV